MDVQYLQCDQMWLNFAKVTKFQTLWQFFYSLFSICQNCWTLVGNFTMPLGHILLLQMGKYWKNNIAIWSHCWSTTIRAQRWQRSVIFQDYKQSYLNQASLHHSRRYLRRLFRRLIRSKAEVNDGTRYTQSGCMQLSSKRTFKIGAVWTDFAIYWTLGNFLKPLATIKLPQSPPFLGNFCKGVKIIHFSSKIIFGQLL